MLINGPSGKYLEIDSESRGEVSAVEETLIQHINRIHHRAFSMVFDVAAANAAADELLLYLKNEDEEDLIISEINITISAANIVYGKIGDSGTVGGSPTSITPVNLHSSGGESADGVFYQDDAMSGLSGGSIIFKEYLTADPANINICPGVGIILGKNGVFTLYVETQQAQTIQGNIVFGYH